MFVIEITDGNYSCYFSGWEGSDCTPDCGELTFWRPTADDIEVYEFTDLSEISIEMDLILESEIEFAIGLPEDFCYDEFIIHMKKVRESHDDY